MLDRYVTGTVDRVSPEAPVPVVLVDDEWNAVGGAANVAANIRALGARCDVIGVVGADGAGRAIGRTLEAMGAECRLVPDDGRSTTIKTRVIAQGQQVVRIDREETAAVSRDAEERLKARLDERLPGAGVLVLADYNKGVLSAAVIAHALERAAALGVPVVVDPKRRNFFACGGATVFKPNRGELEAALGRARPPRGPRVDGGGPGPHRVRPPPRDSRGGGDGARLTGGKAGARPRTGQIRVRRFRRRRYRFGCGVGDGRFRRRSHRSGRTRRTCGRGGRRKGRGGDGDAGGNRGIAAGVLIRNSGGAARSIQA